MEPDAIQDRIDRFIQYVNEHHFSIRVYIRALGAKSDWIDDLAQEAFLIAYQRLEDFDEQRGFGTWIRGIARNLVAHEFQCQTRKQRIIAGPLTEYLLQHQARSGDALHQLDKASLLKTMQRCIHKLPKRSRDLLLRRYQKRESAVLLAEEFNLTGDAMRHLLMRIRHTVKKCISIQAKGIM
jgi:RNA polymerase sigma-70 factor, ECF subfamily